MAGDDAGTSQTAQLADQFLRGLQNEIDRSGASGFASSGALNSAKQDLEQGLVRAAQAGAEELHDYLAGVERGIISGDIERNAGLGQAEQEAGVAADDLQVGAGLVSRNDPPPDPLQPFLATNPQGKTGVKWGGKGPDQVRIWTNPGSFSAWLKGHGSSFARWARQPRNQPALEWFRQQNPQAVDRLLREG